MEIFRVNLCFKKSEHSVQTTEDKSKVISQAFKLTLMSHIFKLVLYFNSIITSNQIKYYSARNRGNVLQIQYDFYRYALPLSTMIACYWTSTYRGLKEVNAWNVNVWSTMVKGHKVSLFLWQEELKNMEIVNTQGSDNELSK